MPSERLPTTNQAEVLAALRRRGLHFTADASAAAWRAGRPYYIDARLGVGRGLRGRFALGNREALFSGRRSR